ncbi:hypothetical protein MD484_g2234, partial [Candolleomyces efflorescens]
MARLQDLPPEILIDIAELIQHSPHSSVSPTSSYCDQSQPTPPTPSTTSLWACSSLCRILRAVFRPYAWARVNIPHNQNGGGRVQLSPDQTFLRSLSKFHALVVAYPEIGGYVRELGVYLPTGGGSESTGSSSSGSGGFGAAGFLRWGSTSSSSEAEDQGSLEHEESASEGNGEWQDIFPSLVKRLTRVRKVKVVSSQCHSSGPPPTPPPRSPGFRVDWDILSPSLRTGFETLFALETLSEVELMGVVVPPRMLFGLPPSPHPHPGGNSGSGGSSSSTTAIGTSRRNSTGSKTKLLRNLRNLVLVAHCPMSPKRLEQIDGMGSSSFGTPGFAFASSTSSSSSSLSSSATPPSSSPPNAYSRVRNTYPVNTIYPSMDTDTPGPDSDSETTLSPTIRSLTLGYCDSTFLRYITRYYPGAFASLTRLTLNVIERDLPFCQFFLDQGLTSGGSTPSSSPPTPSSFSTTSFSSTHGYSGVDTTTPTRYCPLEEFDLTIRCNTASSFFGHIFDIHSLDFSRCCALPDSLGSDSDGEYDTGRHRVGGLKKLTLRYLLLSQVTEVNASNFSTGDVSFNIQQNNNIKNYFRADSGKDPLELLLQRTTKETTHESVTYSYAPTCHPSTRGIIKTDIMDFIHDSGKPKYLRLVEECLAGNILAGSFFFGRDFGRDNADGFVATIAHQLCNVVPGFREAILKKISFDPSIFDKSLFVQAQRLIFYSLQGVTDASSWKPRVIIVDGLDECRDLGQRSQVISLLRTLTQHPIFPFCVIVSSRPEFDIYTAFAEKPLLSLTRKFLLHNYDSDEDLMTYLVEEFARIRRTHPAWRILNKNWPTKQALETLVRTASGQFIFVSTVIRYVESHFEIPDLLLDQVLKFVSAHEASQSITKNPFAELDTLYTEILQLQVPPTLAKHTRLILHAIPEIWRIVETNSLLTMSGDLKLGPSPGMLDAFFGSTLTELVLPRLYALLHVPNNSTGGLNTEYIHFYHKSMEDYLKTPHRSGDLFQSEADTVARFVTASFRNLERWSLSLGSPSEDKAATFSALYLCIRFGWNTLPPHDDGRTPRPEPSTEVELAKVLNFDPTILLGWIFLFGRFLWPNPNDMLTHMKPQSSPLEGIRDHWLDPIAEGVKLLHTCERSRLRKWRKKCSLCKTLRLCCRNSRSVFSFLKENWYLEKREKMAKFEDLDKIIFSGSSLRKELDVLTIFSTWLHGLQLPHQVNKISQRSVMEV